MLGTFQIQGDQTAGDDLSIHRHFDDAFADTLRVMDRDVKQPATEPARCGEADP